MSKNELYRLKRQDLKGARDILCQSFLKDPIFEYILESRTDRIAAIRAIQGCNIAIGLNYGEAYAPSNDLEGVAIWLPPGHTGISAWKLIRSGILGILTIPSNRLKVNAQTLQKARQYAAYAEEIHARNAPFPHWYLMMIGVGDAFRGQGYATKLIQPVLNESDEAKLPSYLETHTPKNVEIYKHFGFSVVEEGKLPSSDITHWAMMRVVR
jgi:ribosomal protein S18 acetylase RimI-like enzyme